MTFHVLTIFPEFFQGPFEHGVVARAREAGKVEIRIHNLRDWTHDRHKTVDDRPFGGGEGMLLKPEPVFAAVETIFPERARAERDVRGNLVDAHLGHARIDPALDEEPSPQSEYLCREARARDRLRAPQHRLARRTKAGELEEECAALGAQEVLAPFLLQVARRARVRGEDPVAQSQKRRGVWRARHRGTVGHACDSSRAGRPGPCRRRRR